MNAPYQVAPDIYILPSYAAIPGVGILPVNAFLVTGEEPLLVDTGFRAEWDGFLSALESIMDPAALKYVLLTHDDSEHIGNLTQVMDLAPDAHVFMNALAALRVRYAMDLPLDRVHAIVPGDEIAVGKRRLQVFRPLLFDNPVTLGAWDPHDRVMFSADCFGAILPRWEDQAGGYSDEELAAGMLTWGSFDDPWVAHYDRNMWDGLLARARAMDAELVLSSHLPPAKGLLDQMLQTLAGLPDVAPFVPPDHTAFAQIAAALSAAAKEPATVA